MQRTRTTTVSLGAGALVLAGAVFAVNHAVDRASADRASAPRVQVTVDPDIGYYTPTVRIEKVRRAGDGSHGTSGGVGKVDTGLINFEVVIENLGAEAIEIDRLTTGFLGQQNPLPGGWFEGIGTGDLMYEDNAFSEDGNVIIESKDSNYTVAAALAALDDDDGDYVLAGTGFDDAVLKFYVSRRADWRAQLDAEAMPFEGRAYAVAALPGLDPAPVVVGGQRGNAANQRAVIAKYLTGGDSLALDDSFGNGGVADLDLLFHEYPEVVEVATTSVNGQTYILAAGTSFQQGEPRRFLARLRADGSPDESFGGLGIVVLPQTAERHQPVGLALRVEPGDTTPSIYLLEAVGPKCHDEGLDCRAELRRYNWGGSLDGGFAQNGVAEPIWPDSMSDVPFGIDFDAAGGIILGATRMQNGSQAPWIGLTRLTADGITDNAFANFGYRVASVDLLPVGGRGLQVSGGEIAVGAMLLVPGKKEVALLRFDGDGNLTQTTSNRQDSEEEPRINDFAIDKAGRYLLAGDETGEVQLTRFRSDGRLDWRGVIDPGTSQRVAWPDDREVAEFPSHVQLDIWLEEWVLPYTVTPVVKEDAFAVDFPISDPGEHENWRVSRHHRLRDPHRRATSQRYAYDIGVWRWSVPFQKWTPYVKVPDENAPENEKFLSYGRKIIAARGGVVIACWNTAPENSDPPNTDEFFDNDMPGGGNLVKIRHDDGSIALYAHMQPGSVAICPNTCTTYVSDASDPWDPEEDDDTCDDDIAPDEKIEVKTGDYLGLLGNSGRSTRPHLHFHVTDSADSGRPIYLGNAKTDRQIEPAEQTGAVGLYGSATVAPVLDGVHNLMWPTW